MVSLAQVLFKGERLQLGHLGSEWAVGHVTQIKFCWAINMTIVAGIRRSVDNSITTGFNASFPPLIDEESVNRLDSSILLFPSC